MPNSSRYAGVHLSGPNAPKTAVVVLEGRPFRSPLSIGKVYEKIGAFGTLFSDERLVEILTRAGPFAEVFVDCPLTVPPCVACQRPVCPGAMQCDDTAVAYMLALSSKVRRKGARKARPINPQSQRLWDVLHAHAPSGERLEPSYSANQAPLVARALTLQRRLKALTPELLLKETSVGLSLEAARAALGLPEAVKMRYRSFEDGPAQRRDILEALVERGWVEADETDEYRSVAQSVEVFNAFMAAWVGALHEAGLTTERTAGFLDAEGWVYLPQMTGKVKPPQPKYFE